MRGTGTNCKCKETAKLTGGFTWCLAEIPLERHHLLLPHCKASHSSHSNSFFTTGQGAGWDGIITTPFSPRNQLSLYQCLFSNLTLLLPNATLMHQSASAPAMSMIKNVTDMPLKCKKHFSFPLETPRSAVHCYDTPVWKGKICSPKNLKCWKKLEMFSSENVPLLPLLPVRAIVALRMASFQPC